MTKPRALLFYEALLPGSRLIHRLEDLGYEVLIHTHAETLVAEARQFKPLLLIIDLDTRKSDLCAVIRELRTNPDTAHLPVLAFANDGLAALRTAAHNAGATLVAGDTAVLAHLPELLDQALEAGL